VPVCGIAATILLRKSKKEGFWGCDVDVERYEVVFLGTDWMWHTSSSSCSSI